MIFKNNDLFIGGDCNYKGKIIFEFFKKRNIKPENIHIENENCLQTGIKVKNDVKEGMFFYNSKLNPFVSLLKIIQIQDIKFPRVFEIDSGEKIVFFAPHKENIMQLIQKVSNGKGRIVLQFAFKSKDSKEDWNRLKSVLGVGKNWKFILPEELGEE